MDTIRVVFAKIRTLFRFSKMAGEASPLPISCGPVNVAEYASTVLNMPKYPLKSLNKLLTMLRL